MSLNSDNEDSSIPPEVHSILQNYALSIGLLIPKISPMTLSIIYFHFESSQQKSLVVISSFHKTPSSCSENN